jgi:serine/threonine-protein kinase
MTAPQRLGKYQIVEVLGKGAMGVVYRAFDPDIHRTVAIKTIRKELVDDQERAAMMFARFKNEARAAGRLSHPGIVAVHDYGDTGEVTYIAMEFVQGMSLRDYFNRGTRFQEHDLVSIMAQLLEALQHAHEQGVWHRDIKPANLIVMNNGRVKIADFGIAKVDTSQLTQTGLVMGSPGYMAPEQYSGGAVDWRADLFATGVVMYQLLTGVRAFAGTTEQMAYKVCHTHPPPASEADPGRGWERYDPVIKRALAKEPDARFQTAESFRAAILEAYAAPVSPTVSEETIIAEATRPVVVFEPSNPSSRTSPDQTPPPVARPIPAPPAATAVDPAAATVAIPRTRSRLPVYAGAAAVVVALAAAMIVMLRGSPAPVPAAKAPEPGVPPRLAKAVEASPVARVEPPPAQKVERPAPEAQKTAKPAARVEPPAQRVERPAPEAQRPAKAVPPPAAKVAAPSPPSPPAPPAPERTAAAKPAPAPAPPAPKPEAARQEEPPTGYWRDQGITTKVAGKLQFNRRLWRTGIQIETKEGVVTLRGNVPSQELIDEAVRITREVYGVRAVRNELKIGQPDYSSSLGSGG